MTQIDYSRIDKPKFISYLWHSIHDMAFMDIQRASDGKAKMGAFILASCFIECLAGFRYGKETNNNDYKNFVRIYLQGKYDTEKLYKDLRCKLVHNYSEGGSYEFVDNHPELHRAESQGGKVVLNLENFIADIGDALQTYFNELRTDDKIFKLAVDRYFKLNVLGINPTQIINMDITNKQVIEAIKLAITRRVLKVSDLQREFFRGSNWGDKMMAILEQHKIVSSSKGAIPRDVIASPKDAEIIIQSLGDGEEKKN